MTNTNTNTIADKVKEACETHNTLNLVDLQTYRINSFISDISKQLATLRSFVSCSKTNKILIPKPSTISSADFHKIRNQFESLLDKNIYDVGVCSINTRCSGDSFDITIKVIDGE